MTLLGDDFRKRAESNNAEAKQFFESPEFATSPKIQASAVISKVTANTLYLLGEVVDYLRGSDAVDASAERRARYAERNEAIRKAYLAGVQSGDFTNFDQLVSDFAASVGGGE